MGLRFNPSSTPETTQGLSNITSMAMKEWSTQYAQQQKLEEAKRQLEIMQKMGLIGGMDQGGVVPQGPVTQGGMPGLTGMPMTPPPDAAMSLPNGQVGDTQGNQLEQTMQMPKPAQAKKAAPFLAVPKPTGGYAFIKNPDYKSTSTSSISSYDMTGLKAPKTDEERQAAIEALPPDLAENVKAAGEYRLDSNKLYGLRNNSGDRAKFDSLVNKLYPGWNMQKYAQRQAYMNDVAKGKTSQQVLALNTLAKHIDTFDNAIDELANTNGKPQNAIINFAKDLTGDPTITDFKFAKKVVNSEMERLLTGVGVTQSGMKEVGSILSDNAGFKQMKSASGLLKTLVMGRAQPLRTQYKNMMGEEENGQILFPESKGILGTDNSYGKNLKTGSKSASQDYSSLWN